jgi:hypothetical protein
MINFASFRSATTSSEEALSIPQIRTVVIIAEGVPERHAKLLSAKAKALGKVIIGPTTVGGIKFAWELNRLHHLPRLGFEERYEPCPAGKGKTRAEGSNTRLDRSLWWLRTAASLKQLATFWA